MITLSAKIKILGEYSGKSKFKFWTSLSKGDILEVSAEISSIGHYKLLVEVRNLNNDLSFGTTINDFTNYLNKIKFEIVN